MHHDSPRSLSMLVLYIAKHVCLFVRLEWAEVGGANIETMVTKDVIGVHLLPQEQVKAMINAINTGGGKSEGLTWYQYNWNEAGHAILQRLCVFNIPIYNFSLQDREILGLDYFVAFIKQLKLRLH